MREDCSPSPTNLKCRVVLCPPVAQQDPRKPSVQTFIDEFVSGPDVQLDLSNAQDRDRLIEIFRFQIKSGKFDR